MGNQFLNNFIESEGNIMIYTLTFNPSLDYIVTVPEFALGKVNRTKTECMFPGGKGINVSIMLKNLGMESKILGFIAGFTGKEIQHRLKEINCSEELIMLKKGNSRINVKLRSEKETEINGIGPVIEEQAVMRLQDRINEIKKGDVLVLSGSIPASLPNTMYRDILESIKGKEVLTVVDATKELLLNVLPYHPFLIKPNIYELGELFGIEISEKSEIVTYAKRLQEKGAKNVLVSMAGDGAILVAEDGTVYESPAPKGTVRNSVGAGDSMVAGFLYGYLRTGEYKKAFQIGVAAGSASAFSETLATKENVELILQTILRS